jgi:hypothetical protein
MENFIFWHVILGAPNPYGNNVGNIHINNYFLFLFHTQFSIFSENNSITNIFIEVNSHVQFNNFHFISMFLSTLKNLIHHFPNMAYKC